MIIDNCRVEYTKPENKHRSTSSYTLQSCVTWAKLIFSFYQSEAECHRAHCYAGSKVTFYQPQPFRWAGRCQTRWSADIRISQRKSSSPKAKICNQCHHVCCKSQKQSSWLESCTAQTFFSSFLLTAAI